MSVDGNTDLPVPKLDKRTKERPGDRYGRWTILRRAAGVSNARARVTWVCRCDCGAEKFIVGEQLRAGRSKSCGCLRDELARARPRTHGGRRTPEYSVWRGMLTRCNNHNEAAFRSYGGRGIKVCEQWNDFAAFYADMGPRPAGTTIERVDNNRGYEPSNCVWADAKTQARNKRTAVILELDGVRMSMPQWADLLCVHLELLDNRLRKGWSHERMLTTTPRKQKNQRRSLVYGAVVVIALLIGFGRAVAQDPEDGLVSANLVGDESTVAPPVLRPQLVRRDHTSAVVIGASSAVIGGVGLVSAWALYIARANFRLTPRSVVTRDTLDSWTTQGAYSFWIGAGSSALIVTAEALLLPESDSVPFLGWFAGGSGLVLAAVGVGYAVGGTHCAPTAVRPGADILLACSSMGSDAMFGSLLLVTSAPLMAVPITYLLRKAFAGAPESLSFGVGRVDVSGRF